jgi:hypothetical protein
MKFLFGVLVFTVSLIVSVESLATSSSQTPTSPTPPGAHAAKGHQDPSHARDNTSLFPPKKPNMDLATQPARVELVEPSIMSKVPGNTVTLKWQAAANAESYHLQVATDPNFKWLKYEENLYKNTSYELKNLEPGKHYYWRVASIKSGNNPGTTKSDFVKSMFETIVK